MFSFTFTLVVLQFSESGMTLYDDGFFCPLRNVFYSLEKTKGMSVILVHLGLSLFWGMLCGWYFKIYYWIAMKMFSSVLSGCGDFSSRLVIHCALPWKLFLTEWLGYIKCSVFVRYMKYIAS